MLTIYTAKTFFARLIGLLGKSNLPPDEALLIPHCMGVHTWFMRFPIDVVWLDWQNKVIEIQANLGPWRVARGPKGTVACLELAEGGAGKHALFVGNDIASLLN
ncbi:MAG: DUF192 domain-containing protein [Candidatus Magasanikbacteria bacterium]|nr:DUF192 domain-containing protein [Candidatus Magasanikbacteria bacterium]